MKKIVLIAKAKIANWRSNRGHIKNYSVEKTMKLDMIADEAVRDLEFYLDGDER